MSVPEQGPSRGRRRGRVTGRMVLCCLVTFFAVVTAVNAVMIVAAVTTFGGLETASSYKAGLAFAREIAAAEAQRDRQWQVSAALHPQPGGEVRIELTALDRSGRPIADIEAAVRLAHPTDRRLDRSANMAQVGTGRFLGNAGAGPGLWDLVIELERGGERLFRSRERVVLKAAP